MNIDEIANRYVTDWAALHPTQATIAGIDDQNDRLDDLSPDGFAAQADLKRRTVAELDTTTPRTARESVAKESMLERLSLEVAQYELGYATGQVSAVDGGVYLMRIVFDLMPAQGEQAAANIAARLNAFPDALEKYRRTLREAKGGGSLGPRSQIIALAAECEQWIDPEGDNFFPTLAERVGAEGTLQVELGRGADIAAAAVAEFAEFLRRDLAPYGAAHDAIGPERYSLASRDFLGADVDLLEAYAWGFAELDRIEKDMRSEAACIAGPGATIDEAIDKLNDDPARRITGKEAFRDWMQNLSGDAIAALDGVHFDIPEKLRTLQAEIASASSGDIYYTAPNEDFSRPGQMWWSVPPDTQSFSTWQQTSIVYHEGVPGHHLQIGLTQLKTDELNRWQRLLGMVAGHAEGWALYAERLMDDLGFLTDPGDRLGMLDLQRLRAARVILDIGLHLSLKVPDINPFGFHPGETWNTELSWEFLRAHSRISEDYLRFELKRYVGWPGQAPAYKIGERVWRQARDDVKRRKGAAFNLKTFHSHALNLGHLGLDPLRRALAQI